MTCSVGRLRAHRVLAAQFQYTGRIEDRYHVRCAALPRLTPYCQRRERRDSRS
jgi:hypothetical protein